MTTAKSYYRIMLGKGSMHADECHRDGWFGGFWDFDMDLTDRLPDDWRVFNKEFIPIYIEKHPGKSKVTAGLACGMLHTICKGIKVGDIIFSPNGKGAYYVGDVTSDYNYVPDIFFPHQRSVTWRPDLVNRQEMSEGLKNSTGSVGTVSNITKHAKEIEGLISGEPANVIISTDDTVEDPTVFALEKHLEAFLVHNWDSTELGKDYDIYADNDELVGQQYPSDTGPIDILAISKDKKVLLVVELKKGRASDVVVGQVQRYMGYVLGDLAEPDQTVRGVIIAMEDDLRLKRALSVTTNIEFYRYQVSFKLTKV